MIVPSHQSSRRFNTGAVLFEIVLALVLFTFSVTIISSSFSASLPQRGSDARHELDGANLATSTLAEIELGLKPLVTAPPTVFEPPFEKVDLADQVTEPSEDLDMGGGLSLVEVIIQSEELGRETRLARMI